MFGFGKQIFLSAIIFLGCNLSSVNLLEYVSMNNQECKIRPEIVNVNRNKPVFFCFSVREIKCSGSCNNINNPYAKLRVPDVLKNLNAKVYNLMLNLI